MKNIGNLAISGLLVLLIIASLAIVATQTEISIPVFILFSALYIKLAMMLSHVGVKKPH